MKLAYRETGSGRPLVILHGLFGQSDNWNSLAKSFSEVGLRVFTVDLRNHGLSPHSDTWNYEVMAQDIKEFLDEHRLEKPVLLGHSMGGKVVLLFEKIFSGLASALIVADMAPRYYAPHHQQVIKALQAVDFGTVQNRKDAEAILGTYLSDVGTRQFLLKNIYWRESDRLDWRFNLETISRHIEELGVEVPFYTSSTPCLVLRGERSNYIGEEDLKEFGKRFSNLETVTVPAAGHWLHAEQPAAFFKAVTDFIRARGL